MAARSPGREPRWIALAIHGQEITYVAAEHVTDAGERGEPDRGRVIVRAPTLVAVGRGPSSEALSRSTPCLVPLLADLHRRSPVIAWSGSADAGCGYALGCESSPLAHPPGCTVWFNAWWGPRGKKRDGEIQTARRVRNGGATRSPVGEDMRHDISSHRRTACVGSSGHYDVYPARCHAATHAVAPPGSGAGRSCGFSDGWPLWS